MPAALTAGCTLNSGLLAFVTTKSTSWPDSPVPWLMAVAQPATDWAPESCETLWLAPLVKLGTALAGLTVRVTVTTLVESKTPSLAL